MNNRLENCPYCESIERNDYCTDWQGNQYVRCISCSLVYQKEYDEFDYSSSYWKQAKDPDGCERNLTEEYDSKIRNWYGGIIPYINAMPAGRILDYGCGLGFLLGAINPDWERVGYDIEEEPIALMHERFGSIRGYSSYEGIEEDYGRNAFDVVVCYHVLEHVADPYSLFDRLCENLKESGGVLIVGTPNIGGVCARWFRGNFRLLGNGHICLYTPEHVNALFSKSHLSIIRKEYPFFGTDYFTVKNLLRMFNPFGVSPPFYGNVMTYYGRRQ